MIDKEKVCYSLERCSFGGPDACQDCDYDKWPPRICVQHLTKDALDLIRTQKPINAIRVYLDKDSDGGSTQWYVCGACKTSIEYHDKFCHECGRAMKWDD